MGEGVSEAGSGRWCWFDRWTGKVFKSGGYPAAWDELPSDEYKPTIIAWFDGDEHSPADRERGGGGD